MDNAHIDIIGLNKAAVLAALYNATKPLGLGILHDLKRDMTVDEAQKMIDGRSDLPPKLALSFDYVCGRPVKCDLGGDSFDP